MTLEELKQVPILECRIIFPEESKDPVYEHCNSKEWNTIGDFLYSFSPKAQSPCVIMQLKGIFDLLCFKYFEKLSTEVLRILEKSFFLYIDQQPIVSIDLLARLGFSPAERECLTAYLISQNKGIISIETLICYLVNLFHDIKTKQYSIQLSNQESSIFETKLILLINLYRKSFCKKELEEKQEVYQKKEMQQLKMEKH